ncbi:transcription elongation factor s-II, putative [Plasmodium vivax]|uniref:Transcription elongation factor, putative n=5 Tax=Plasmodium vivax TaxID=5855 RepID=A5JZL5_PLAVS|nr:transcription elongation factor, putative [Plasmodium vivax]KMZ84315.1 transcription elongation factor [Plasmodium vivax Brazil I]KMZ90095.1 transcription elongation factor [Plasmodium vivax Mauritania I]KMZ97202.1 transcription elongation factor [Plasmodium vivax North Korean]EDL47426.1 transcription elongation factor, putative [Plasmodium vivax]CAI7723394.1 transcription elongation factor s-II, putative [Plasmodium vivax]|eukprot:XP_001617153.1 transcription elongation factor [Plasmodium vivax Sal-1]
MHSHKLPLSVRRPPAPPPQDFFFFNPPVKNMTLTENIAKITTIQERLKDKESKFVSANEEEAEEEAEAGAEAEEQKKTIDESTIKEIIEDLISLKDVEINKDILKQTKIGVTVNKFTKIKNEEIQNVAKDLVDKWKNIAIKEKHSSTGSRSAESLKKRKSELVEGSDNNTCSEDYELKKVKVKNVSEHSAKQGTIQSGSPNHGEPNNKADHLLFSKHHNSDHLPIKGSVQNSYHFSELKHVNTDLKALTEWNYNGKFHNDVLRDKAKQFLFKAFITGSDDNLLYLIDRKKLNDIIYNIENELHKFFIEKKQSQKEYNMQLKSIKFNLCDKKNPSFNEKIYAEYIPPRTIATMNSQEMASDEKKKERNKCLQESLQACQSDWDVKNILLKKTRKGEFQCFKCKGYETVYHQLQTRSSDEPMTTFVTCLKCNNRWKF